ncbi:MAG TPA: hypothetical protein VMZ90_08250, partial [Vicinamibacterales bacterium]|nr:hypothetical protein [Vicinamibacterales bacterium]
MTRCARDRRVYFVEEPIFEPGVTPALRVEATSTVTVVVPILPDGCPAEESIRHQRRLLDA